MDTSPAPAIVPETPNSTALSVDIDTVLNARIATATHRIDELTLSLTQLEGDETPAKWKEIQNEIDGEREKLKCMRSALVARQESHQLHLELSNPSRPVKPSPETSSPAESSQKVPRDLPKFRDGPGSVRDPEDFLPRFQRVLSAHGLDLEQHWYRLLPVCLNHADNMWCESNLEPTLTWQKAKAQRRT